MRKLIWLPLLLLNVLACNEEENPTAKDCYLSEVSASNSETNKFVMKDGKLIQTAWGTTVSDAVYTYDGDGKLLKIVAGTLEIRYSYNGKNKMILAETISDGTLVSKLEYKYDQQGFPTLSLSSHNLNGATQSFVETTIEYKDGNPVKRTAYLYTSSNPEKSNPLVTEIKYDDKKNPYNTLNSTVGEPAKNNAIEYNYLSDAQSKTVVTYTYNELGYPVTYNQHYPNRTDGYADVSGTFTYDCSGN